MKVICKCCFRPFDYDMYMGLCPKCGRVYRREKGMYSEVERDMVGDFHLHADDGGLNRGIDGVVYNQPGSVSEKNTKNGFDEEYLDKHRYVKSASKSVIQTASPAERQVSNTYNAKTGGQAMPVNGKGEYYSPDHKTQMNKEITPKGKKGGGLAVLIWIIIIAIAIVSSILDN